MPHTAGGKQAKADEGGEEQKEDGKEEKEGGTEEKKLELPPIVSCHDIAGIWVAFFSRCQRYRC